MTTKQGLSESFQVSLELFQKHWKTSKSSVPVLSAAKPWFSQGFSHFWAVPLEFCSAHATPCMAPAALFFASRTQIRVVFRVARVVKTLGFCMSPVWYRSTPVEAVGFELVEKCFEVQGR